MIHEATRELAYISGIETGFLCKTEFRKNKLPDLKVGHALVSDLLNKLVWHLEIAFKIDFLYPKVMFTEMQKFLHIFSIQLVMS